MMGSLKKPRQLTIRKHVSRCEVMNGYIGHLPMLQDRPLAVASTEKGNVPFNTATLASIILATCPTDWRNQYKMNHKTVPESIKSILFDLENIKKVFAAKTARKPGPTGPWLAQSPRKELVCPGNSGREAVMEDRPPRKHTPTSTASGARRWVGPSRRTTPVSVAGLTRTARR